MNAVSERADILTRIINRKKARVEDLYKSFAVEDLRDAAHQARAVSTPHKFREALAANDKPFNIIAEYKRASPSKGAIRVDVAPAEIAQMYARGGAAAMSILTEQDFFQGSLDDLRAVRQEGVNLPLLRKDFTIDAIQIYEAAAAGADAVLLIVAALEDEKLIEFRCLAEDELKIDALVEVHTATEMRRAIDCKAKIIGVNNRNLHSFQVSLDTSRELIKLAPADALMISESGLGSRRDLSELRDIGYQGFLIGEQLMRTSNAAKALREWLK